MSGDPEVPREEEDGQQFWRENEVVLGREETEATWGREVVRPNKFGQSGAEGSPMLPYNCSTMF
jgi:hypothetical protein